MCVCMWQSAIPSVQCTPPKPCSLNFTFLFNHVVIKSPSSVAFVARCTRLSVFDERKKERRRRKKGAESFLSRCSKLGHMLCGVRWIETTLAEQVNIMWLSICPYTVHVSFCSFFVLSCTFSVLVLYFLCSFSFCSSVLFLFYFVSPCFRDLTGLNGYVRSGTLSPQLA